MEAADALRFAQGLWGLDAASADALPGERDRNFLLTDRAGARWVLKVAPAAAPPARIRAEMDALAWAVSRDATLPLPRVRPTTAGESVGAVTDASGQGHVARILTHLPGDPLADVLPRPPGLLRELGRILARLDVALSGAPPVGSPEPGFPWEPERAAEVIAGGLATLPAPRHALVGRVAEAFEREARSGLGALPRATIHGDANDHNVLVGDGGRWVAGLIDFGDLMEAPRAQEPAVAAAYALLGQADPVAAAAQVAAGYHEISPLSDEEIRVIWPLARARLGVSVTLSAARAAAARSDPYLRVSEAPAWAALEATDRVDPHRAAEALARACRSRRRSPHPAAAVREAAAASHAPPEALLERRRRLLGPNLSVSYRRPLHVVRGAGAHLYDERGDAYLDCVNNVAHVGHAHPAVVDAAARQKALLETNTRYLHGAVLELAERLVATLPEPLTVCWFVSSGSEANELALRIARTATGRSDVVVLGAAYHGNTTTLVDVSPYKHAGPGGRGAPPWVHVAAAPDDYRGRWRRDDPDAGLRYAGEVADALARANGSGPGAAAFLHETLLSCAGQVEPPPGYLPAAYDAARAAGAVVIADEVQVGLGRVGSHFWGFQTQGAVPDVVTVGKPLGNGHPVAAVVTTPELARAFANGIEYFSTFGGNPVSCAAALAVLDVLRDEGLQRSAQRTGELLLAGLQGLAARDARLGDVRGRGLFLGVELVESPESRTPDAELADRLVQGARDRGVLLSTDGPDHNVIKIKPPMVFGAADAERLVTVLGELLEEDRARRR